MLKVVPLFSTSTSYLPKRILTLTAGQLDRAQEKQTQYEPYPPDVRVQR